MTLRLPWQKTPVANLGVYWHTQKRKGEFYLQYNPNPVLSSYKYRIVREPEGSFACIEATASTETEIWHD